MLLFKHTWIYPEIHVQITGIFTLLDGREKKKEYGNGGQGSE
jgi:hypothetical protein